MSERIGGDGAALLASLREARAEVERLRPIVEAVVEMDPWQEHADAGEVCRFCGVASDLSHVAGCLIGRARAALHPERAA